MCMCILCVDKKNKFFYFLFLFTFFSWKPSCLVPFIYIHRTSFQVLQGFERVKCLGSHTVNKKSTLGIRFFYGLSR